MQPLTSAEIDTVRSYLQRHVTEEIEGDGYRGSYCWTWMGGTSHGRPSMSLRGRSTSVARVVWLLRHGSDPRSGAVGHGCENPLCVNPDHLVDGRSYAGGRPRKLSPQQVDRVRQDAQLGRHTLRGIAEMYGISIATVRRIKSGLY